MTFRSYLLALTWPALAFSLPSSLQIHSANSRTIVSNDSSIWPWQTYVSTNVTPPYLEINRSADVSLGPGYIFFDPELNAKTGLKVEAPFILTDYNELIWAGPEGLEASNFRQQFWGDQSVISFWVGTGKTAEGQAAGHGWGEVLIYDNAYKQIKSICLQLNLTLPTGATTDCEADAHESFITQDDTILLTAYNVSRADLTSLGGSNNGWVYDSIALEYDLRTDEVIFVWSPLAHLPVNLTHLPYTGDSIATPFDWFHINSIQKVGDHYLINSRHLWKTFFVNKKGEIVWEIDGRTGGDFGPLPNNITFSWQHMARLHDVNKDSALLTYYNNHANGTTTVPSTALELRLSFPPNPEKPPQLVANLYDSVAPITSSAAGSHELLSNGNHFVGYGVEPYIKEFAADGTLVWSAQFADKNLALSYRAYKQEWHATPYTLPSLVVRSVSDDILSPLSPSSLRGYVSWNGATDVTGYRVYTNTTDGTSLLGTFNKQGFETVFVVPQGTQAVQVGALQGGQEVRRSKWVNTNSD
ncbi:hypothetical protein ZTR_00841 [Talaromyces verruculosus]|nr:hypothetical protein ZTR_00841 [Talaromyces verruculosus]